MQLCGTNNVTVKLSPIFEDGFYYCIDRRHFITISTLIPRQRREFVGWHEFAHFLQNFYEQRTIAAFSCVVDTPEERHADAFAKIVLGHARITGPMDFIEMLMGVERFPHKNL